VTTADAEPKPFIRVTAGAAVRGLLLLVAVAAAALFINIVLNAAIGFGGNIPTVFLERDYMIGVLWGGVLAISIRWWPVTPEERSALLALWAIRLVVTLLAMLVYERQYDFLDSYSYFADSREIALNDFVLDAPFNTRNVTYIFSWLWYVLPPSYHALKVSCAYIGLVGVLVFFRSWRLAAGGASTWPLWVMGLTPSVLFWSSIIGKDPLIFLAIAVATWSTLKLARNGGMGELLALLLALVVMFFVRPWMVPVFGLAVATAFVVRSRYPYVKIAAAVTGLLVIGIAVYYVRDVLGLEEGRLITAIGIVASAWAVGGSATESVVFDTVSDVVYFLPLGVFTALFRPLPGEIGGLFGLLAGMENALLLLVFAWSLIRLVRGKWEFPVVFALAMLVWWCSLYAFLSYQNLGTAVRFKLQVMPFMLALVGLAMAARGGAPAPRRPAGA
jgi:hypothetical protein